MKKSKTSAAVAFAAVEPALIEQVEGVLASAAKNKYQASVVYAAHNQVFGLRETPEVCASCNIKRVAALRKWMAEYKMWQLYGANAEANAEGQAVTNVPRETLGDLDSILREYGAPAFDDVEERDQWLNGLLTQNGLALMGFRQLDAEELEIVNAALVSEGETVVDTRNEATDLQGIYGAFTPAIVGAETQTTDELEGEVAGIKAIIEKHGADLFPGETELLNARLTELTAGAALQEGVNGAMDDAQKFAESTQPGAKGVNESNTIAGGMDEDAPQVLKLKNKKGDAFTGTFNSEDGVNGTLVDDKGVSFKPGTYSNDAGDSYAVQPGGKATYKNDAI